MCIRACNCFDWNFKYMMSFRAFVFVQGGCLLWRYDRLSEQTKIGIILWIVFQIHNLVNCGQILGSSLTCALPVDVLVPGRAVAHVRPVGVYAFTSGAFALLAFVDIWPDEMNKVIESYCPGVSSTLLYATSVQARVPMDEWLVRGHEW